MTDPLHPFAGTDLYGAFRNLADESPSALAVIESSSGARVTREEILCRADALAEIIEQRGISTGELAAVQIPNSADFVAAILALWRLGIVPVPIDRDSTSSEVGRVLSHFGVRLLVFRDRNDDRALLPTLTVRDADPVIHRFEPDTRIALIKLTSGSTGSPKGVVTTAANLLADCTNICTSMRIRPDDRNLGAIPFSHSYGFSNLVMPLVSQGTAVIASNEYLPLSILSLANRYGCTVVPGIPMMFDHLAQLPPGDGHFEYVRTFLSAGAPLPPATSKRFFERFGMPIHSFFGCSECGGIAWDGEGRAVERGVVGMPISGATLGRAADGRLVVQSDAVALGHFDGTTLTRFEPRSLTTDDLVEFTAAGELVVTGRSNDLINTAGKKVNPREVESVILTLDGVRAVKVYGEAAGARGEIVVAAVVAEPDVSREQIRAHCRERLAAHKVPRIVKLLDSIPVDERGKVRRELLARL